jgi:hypothetical protein
MSDTRNISFHSPDSAVSAGGNPSTSLSLPAGAYPAKVPPTKNGISIMTRRRNSEPNTLNSRGQLLPAAINTGKDSAEIVTEKNAVAGLSSPTRSNSSSASDKSELLFEVNSALSPDSNPMTPRQNPSTPIASYLLPAMTPLAHTSGASLVREVNTADEVLAASSTTKMTYAMVASQSTPRKSSISSLTTSSISDLVKARQDELCNFVIRECSGKFTIAGNPQPSDEAIRTTVMECIQHIWEESIEVMAWSNTEVPVGIYYKFKSGYNDIKTFASVGAYAYHAASNLIKAKLLAFLNFSLSDEQQDAPIARFNDLVSKVKTPFDFRQAKVYIPVCYTAEKSESNSTQYIKGSASYFAGKKKCEVIVYLGRDAGKQENIDKRNKWLEFNGPIIDDMKKRGFKVRILTRAELVETSEYKIAEEVFATKLIEISQVHDALIADTIKRLESKSQLSAKKKSPVLTSTPVADTTKKTRSPQKVRINDEEKNAADPAPATTDTAALQLLAKETAALAMNANPQQIDNLAFLLVRSQRYSSSNAQPTYRRRLDFTSTIGQATASDVEVQTELHHSQQEGTFTSPRNSG